MQRDALPIWHHGKSGELYSSGGIGLILLILIVPLLRGRIRGGVEAPELVLTTNYLPYFVKVRSKTLACAGDIVFWGEASTGEEVLKRPFTPRGRRKDFQRLD